MVEEIRVSDMFVRDQGFGKRRAFRRGLREGKERKLLVQGKAKQVGLGT